MREIKFRGYSKINNTWYYGLLGKFDGKYYIECKGGTKPFVEEDSIGQYTGFKDRNDNKIYEGDVVKYCGQELKVLFNKKIGQWLMYSDDNIVAERLCNNLTMTEVVGNIYEEQLKG